MDLQALLASRDDEAPSGDNLEYDPDFITLELAAQPGEEKQAGDEILPAEDPEWGEVRERALAVLERSHDLRAAAYLADALLHLEGVTGFADVTGYVRGLIEDFWDTCHPQLDAEDDNDPTARINALQNLAGTEGSLRRTPLSESRGFGRATLRDLMSASGQAVVDDAMDGDSIKASFQDSDPEVLAARLEAVKKAADDIKAIDKVFAEKLPGQGPDFDDLLQALSMARGALAQHSGGGEDAGEAMDEPGAAASGGGAPMAGGGGGLAGNVNSINDVRNALDRIIAYYERAEPSSPVPVLLARAKRLVGASFMTIMRDMAPGGLENVMIVGGLEDEEE